MSDQSNQTASPISTVQIGLTPVELWIQLIVFYGFLAGVISTTANIAIAMGILKEKKLRNRFFVIVFCLAVQRACLCSSYFTMSIYRSLRTLSLVNTNMKRIYCYFIHLHHYNGGNLEMILLVGLVIDRTLAIVAFKFYRTLSYKQAVLGCTIVITLTTFIQIPLSLYGMNINEIIACINVHSPTLPIFNIYYNHVGLSLTVLVLVLYIALILYIKCRYMQKIQKQWERTGDQSGMIAFKRHSKLLPLLQRSVFMHCGVTLLGQIFGSSSVLTPPNIGLRLTYWSGIMATIDIFSNVVILLASHKDLRKAAFPFWFKNENTVNTIPMVQMQTGQRTSPRR